MWCTHCSLRWLHLQTCIGELFCCAVRVWLVVSRDNWAFLRAASHSLFRWAVAVVVLVFRVFRGYSHSLAGCGQRTVVALTTTLRFDLATLLHVVYLLCTDVAAFAGAYWWIVLSRSPYVANDMYWSLALFVEHHSRCFVVSE